MPSGELANTPQFRATMDRLESVKHTAPNGKDLWNAREINAILGYPTWREFEEVIERAKRACSGTGVDPQKHFVPTHKMVEVGSGARREVDDYFLSRAACYLVAMNGDPGKPEVAAAQAYFTVQTRRMELADEKAKQMANYEKRLELREKVSRSVRRVSGVAKDAGVKRHALFHDARYRGLYGGLGGRDIKRRKGLPEKENPFDHFGALELSAHEFQMNLAADVIAKEAIKTEEGAIQRNRGVGEQVRDTIKRSGGTMPENLPLEEPIHDVKKLVRSQAKLSPSDPST
jgi:DNA-damage-inducible protein D